LFGFSKLNLKYKRLMTISSGAACPTIKQTLITVEAFPPISSAETTTGRRQIIRKGVSFSKKQ
jgi:hypothetical protein